MTHCQGNDSHGTQEEVVERILLPRINVARGVQMHEDLDTIPRYIDNEPYGRQVGVYAQSAEQVVLINGYARDVAAQV